MKIVVLMIIINVIMLIIIIITLLLSKFWRFKVITIFDKISKTIEQ